MKSLASLLTPLVLRIGSTKAIVLNAHKKVIFEAPARVAVSLTSGRIVAFGDAALDLATLGAPDISILPLFARGIPVDESLCREYLLWMRESFTTTRLRQVIPYPIITVLPVGFPKPYKDILDGTLRSAHFFPISWQESVVGDAWMELGKETLHSQVIVIRMGATQTQVALLGHGAVINHQVIQVGGEDLDREFVRFIRRHFESSLPLSMSSPVKEAYTKALFARTPFSFVLRGKNVHTNELQSITLTQADLDPLYTQFFDTLAVSIFEVVNTRLQTGPTQSKTIVFLSGGLSLFPQAKHALESHLGCEVKVVSRPTIASVIGTVAKNT